MLAPDSKYNGTVTRGDWIESAKGTQGFQVDIETADGDVISHVLWLTEKTQEYFARDMKTLGVTAEKLRSGSYLTHELPSAVCGREITFGTKEEEYKGEFRTKVAWIGEKRESNPRGIGFAVAEMFGGAKVPEPDAAGDNIEDDDIPFAWIPFAVLSLFSIGFC